MKIHYEREMDIKVSCCRVDFQRALICTSTQKETQNSQKSKINSYTKIKKSLPEYDLEFFSDILWLESNDKTNKDAKCKWFTCLWSSLQVLSLCRLYLTWILTYYLSFSYVRDNQC